jgi:hypothetical protein
MPLRTRKDRLLERRTGKQHVESRHICFILDVGAIYNGGSWSNTFSSKVMRVNVMNMTAMANSTGIRTRQDRSLIKGDHMETRLIHAFFVCGAFHVGATRNKTTTGRMMRIHVNNKAAHSKLKSNGAEKKPPMNK